MGTRSTVKGYWRQGGNSVSNKPTPAVLPAVIRVSFDSAAANTTLTGVWMPKGAIVLSIAMDGGGTGGTTPAVDIGWTGDPDGIVNGTDPTAAGVIALGVATAGAAFVTPLTADFEVTAGDDGTGTASTGTVVATITYYMDDDGSVNN